MNYLGAGRYINSFFNAGYDLEFISSRGISDEDLDCVGVPLTKLGLRRKLKDLHKLENFYSARDDEDKSESDEISDQEEDEDEERSEEDDD